MTRKIKIVGLVSATVLAVCAFAVTAAQAESEFVAIETIGEGEEATESVAEATLSATQVEGEPISLTVGELTTSCTSVTATGTQEAGGSEWMALTPSYSGCKTAGILSAEFSVNSCAYEFEAMEQLEEDSYEALADVGCPSEEGMTLTIWGPFKIKTTCVMHVVPQSGLSGVEVQDMTEANPDDITVTSAIEELTVVVENGKETCPVSPGAYNESKLTGNTTVTATNGPETPPIDERIVPKKRFHFALEEEDVLVKGTEDTVQKFTFDLGVVECTEVLLEDSISAKDPRIYYFFGTPVYGACLFEGNAATISADGCIYRLDAKAIEFGQFMGRAFIECEAGKEIEVKTTNCTIAIPAQDGIKKEGLRGLRYANLGTKANREITAEFTLSGIRYEEFGKECKTSGMTLNGKLVGSWYLKGREAQGANAVGVWAEPT